MRSAIGFLLASGVWLGMASDSRAQSSLYSGPGSYGSSLSMSGSPYGASYATSGLMGGSNYYSPGYYSYPGSFSYSSGYSGYAPANSLYNGFGYGYYPTGVRAGFRPFRPWRRYYR